MRSDRQDGQCRSCGADIYWVTMMTGKKMPIDRASERRIVDTGYGWKVDIAYRSHFETCPKADQHRRRRDGAA